MCINQNKKKHVMLLLILTPFLMGITVDLYIPSLPIITGYFNTSSSLVQLTIGSYMLSYSISQIFLGVLSDSFGRKKILVYSGFFYTIASLLASFSPNIYFLILCRFLQGIGTGGLSVALRAAAVDCFSEKALTKAFNYVSIGWSVGPIVGPFIGGYLQHYLNWQADFYFFALYGFIITLLLIFALPETNHKPQPLHAKKILNNLKITISHPVFLIMSIICSLIYAQVVIFNVIGPFLIQTVLHVSVIKYGRLALILGIAYFAGNTTNRLLINYFRPANIVLTAISSALIVSIIMIILGLLFNVNLLLVIIPTWLIFFLGGLIFPNTMGKLSSIFPDNAGTASAVSGLLIAGMVAILSSLATLLKTTSQIPLAISYFAILLISLGLFIAATIKNKR